MICLNRGLISSHNSTTGLLRFCLNLVAKMSTAKHCRLLSVVVQTTWCSGSYEIFSHANTIPLLTDGHTDGRNRYINVTRTVMSECERAIQLDEHWAVHSIQVLVNEGSLEGKSLILFQWNSSCSCLNVPGDEGEDVDVDAPKIYEPIESYAQLSDRLKMYQCQYNEIIRGSQMDLVFFKVSTAHVYCSYYFHL